ncbi:hypothetical protein [Halodurantibacterium flavum]|uniref:Sulfotransferase domain-containing protein n=1 Tax=Halodurantibacterium flavum TaxID=1382802 RepID=A0ABW4S667_9RHOB
MLLLHVGTQKTGSSSVQHFLRQNAGALRERSINFISASRPWIDHNSVAYELRSDRTDTPKLDAVVADIRKSEHEVNIVSGEMLFHPRVPGRLAERLPPEIRQNAMVVIYLRRPDKYMEALYKQRLKTGAINPNPNKYLEENQWECAYKEVIEGFRRVFGKDSIVIKPYERSLLQAGDIVADFCSLLGITDLSGFQREKPQDNPTFSVAVSELMGMVARKSSLESAKINERIAAENMPGIFYGNDVYPLQLRRDLLSGMKDDLDYIAREYNEQLHKVFAVEDLYSDDPPRLPGKDEVLKRYRQGARAVIGAVAAFVEEKKK